MAKYLHPTATVNFKFVNRSSGSRIKNLLAVRQEFKTVNRRNKLVVVFRHERTDDKEIYCVKRWVKVDKEGAANHFFRDEEECEDDPHPSNSDDMGRKEELEKNVFGATNRSEDIAMLRGMGLDVDDDNEPSPENVPVDPSLPTVTSDKNYKHEGLG